MDAWSCGDGMVINFDASDLAFDLGMKLKRALVREGKRLAAARGERVVTTDDLKAAFEALDRRTLDMVMGEALHGNRQPRRADAA
jgi:hypothetical protein